MKIRHFEKDLIATDNDYLIEDDDCKSIVIVDGELNDRGRICLTCCGYDGVMPLFLTKKMARALARALIEMGEK